MGEVIAEAGLIVQKFYDFYFQSNYIKGAVPAPFLLNKKGYWDLKYMITLIICQKNVLNVNIKAIRVSLQNGI